jgi:type VI secretion system protein ImpG
MSLSDDVLIDYYQRELTYLRRMGTAFAQAYPKIASRLELGPNQSADPNVERLIEAFAFLTGRVQYNLESEFPEFTAALLQVLYPQLVDPMPSMAIARFVVDPTQGKLTSGHTIPRFTQLFCETEAGLRCRFRTAYATTLWPIAIAEAGLVSTDQYDFLDTANVAAVLRIRLVSEGIPFSQLEARRLRFYINADQILSNNLYEVMFSRVDRVAFADEKKRVVIAPADKAIHEVGFAHDEGVLPYPPHSHRAYRVIQEYFSFPEKFRFFDVDLPDLSGRDTQLDILFLLNFVPRERMVIDADTFVMGCTPIINLFPKIVEPIRITHRTTQYRVLSDMRREHTTEVHSVQRVRGRSPEGAESVVYAPFYSFDHAMEERQQSTFWIARRQPTGRKDLPGTDTYLSFLNLNFHPRQPADETIFLHTLCTNRTLAEQVLAGAVLQIEQAAPLQHIVCLTKPTPPRNPAMGGETAWRLVSHLSLNYLSLTEGAHSLRALREILRLYAPPRDAAAEQQILGIRSLATQRVVRRTGGDAWRGFCRGMQITLGFDERQYVGGSAFLFATVLNRFFGLYTTVNSFTELRITSAQRSGIWKTWPALTGSQRVL